MTLLSFDFVSAIDLGTLHALTNIILETTLSINNMYMEDGWQPLQYSCLENPMDRGAWRPQSKGSQAIRHH